MDFSDDSRIELHPVLIRPFGDGNFNIIRWGGKTRIAAREPGADAVRLLRKGCTLGQVKRKLGQKYHSNPAKINLTGLLGTLHRTNLIRSIDGHPVRAAKEVTISSVLRFLLRFYLSRFVRKVAPKVLPSAVSRRVNFWLNYVDQRNAMKPKVSEGTRNMAALLREKTARQVRKLGEEYYRHMIWNVVDIDMLATEKIATIDKWIGTRMTCRGIEHLERERRRNRGVILCAFQFSSTRLIPIFLIKRGYSLTAVGPAGMEWGFQNTTDKIRDLKRHLPNYGDLSLVERAGLDGMRTLVATLRNGGIVLCFAGAFSSPTAGGEAAAEARSRYFRAKAQKFRRSEVRVDLLGQPVDMTAWPGWLSAMSRASVLPVTMLRKPDTSLELRIGSPIDPDRLEGNDMALAANVKLYRALAQDVALHPAQWLGWFALGQSGPEFSGGLACTENGA